MYNENNSKITKNYVTGKIRCMNKSYLEITSGGAAATVGTDDEILYSIVTEVKDKLYIYDFRNVGNPDGPTLTSVRVFNCFNTLYDYYNHIVIQVMNGISPVKNFYSAVFYPDHDEYGYTAVAKNNGDGTFEDVKTELGIKLIETNLD